MKHAVSLLVLGLAPLLACRKSTSSEAPLEGELPICDAPFTCQTFPTSADAFRKVLSTKPRVLAIGESHAPLGTKIPSTTRRFREELLPTVAGLASAMVLELWLGAPRCGKIVQEVAEKQKEVTKGQAKSNSNDFIALGDAAKALGIQPVPLVPSCDDYAPIVDAGAGDVDAMLRLIARLTEASVKERLLTSNEKMVLAYGGSLHNDLAPSPDKAAWSFGPPLAKATGDRYVELDLVTPEFIDDSAPWKKLPWYAAFHRERQGKNAVLMEGGKGIYVLVFPKVAVD